MKNTSGCETLIEKFADIKQKYRNDYPIILYEPAIKCQEKKFLKRLIEKNNSYIHLFTKFREAFKFAQSLGISFLLIVSKYCDKDHILQNFGGLENTFGREMLDFEEEALLTNLFKGHSDQIIKYLNLKVYVFMTLFDCITSIGKMKDEEEVILLCDIQEIVKEFRHDFTIIWFNPSMNAESKAKLEEGIEMSIEENNICASFEKLFMRIKNYTGPPYHLIFSGETKILTQKIIQEIENLKELLGLYIVYGSDLQTGENEKIDVGKTLEELIPQIKRGIRTGSKLKNTFPAFATNFDSSDRSDIYKLHYYLKGLIKFDNRKQAKGDFIKLARKIYQDQEKKLAGFEKTYDEYNKAKIIQWYTKESPIYKLINNCLRISSSYSILYCRFVLKDLERAIREHYQEESKDFNGVVYRGAFISNDEWEKLRINIGKEIEMYGFLSTTLNEKIAVDFLRADLKNKILIKIIIPPLPRLDEQGFADISEFSEYRGEKEILFNVRSRFRILEARVSKIDHRGTECRQLVLLYRAQSLKKYITKEQPSINIELELPSVLKCNLCGLGDKLFGFKQREEIFVKCLECLIKDSIPKDTLLIALDAKGERRVVKTLKGKIFTFQKTVSFSNCGYKCHDCEDQGKEKYYKWVSCDGKDLVIQCLECFEKKETIENKILIAEGSPYSFWQEQEKEWETVNSNYQEFLSQEMQYQDLGDVYLEVQEDSQYVEYGRRVIHQLRNKRRREGFKMSIFFHLGCAYEKLGDFQQALGSLRTSMAIAKFLSGEERSSVAHVYFTIARIHQKLAEYQSALKYFHKGQERQISIYGDKHVSLALVYEGIARVYQSLSENQKALEYFTEALNLQKSVYGEKHPSIAQGYSNLGLLYRELAGYKNALEYFTMALEINEPIYGEKHPETAVLYSCLGSVYSNTGDHQKGIEYEQRALAIQRSFSDAKPDRLMNSYCNLGNMYSSMHQHQKALEYFNLALDIAKSLYGGKHPEIAHLLQSMGGVYRYCGDYKKALECFLLALDKRRSILGENHAAIANSYNDIGSLYDILRKFQKALEYFQKALNIQKSLSKKPHPEIIVTYFSLGRTYWELGEYQKALEHQLEALAVTKVIYGETHRSTIYAYHKLGGTYSGCGDHQKALEYISKALDINESLYGEEHPETADSYDNIGLAYTSLGERQKAFDYHTKSLSIRQSVYGAEHPMIAISYNNLGIFYHTFGKSAKARESFMKALSIAKSLYGEKSPDVAAYYRSLSGVEKKLGFHAKAREYLQKAEEIEGSFPDVNHP